ncbi:MAG: hypothetical protein KatS3mg082_0245 [Nitrospiraceae bacterium]|nr:MAG: hypothetical protein KatS3mg082_0245 [Nitrospiraceae bacterium]
MRRPAATPSFRSVTILACLTVSVSWIAPVWALEKYGRPLPAIGDTEEPGGPEITEQHRLRGYLLTAAFLDNPTFAARPDNTGLVALRHMLHLETDLYKQYLQFYTDQNFFSDRRDGWITLSEWDATFAFTGSLGNWGWRLQYERDAPLDRSGVKQIYADTLVTYRWPDAQQWSWWRTHFPNQNLTTYAGAGWLFHNENYFARPDNTGRALFRYVAHADLDLYRNRLVLFADTNFFTDRSADNAVRPTELDLVVGLALRHGDLELSLIHERDMPLDRGGLVQRYLALQLRYEFEWVRRSSATAR